MFSAAPLTGRRRWLTLSAATLVLQFPYWWIITSFGEGSTETAELFWLGVAVTPFVFLVLAFGSGHPRAPGATGRALGLFPLVGLPVALVDVAVGLVAGFGAAAVVTLRRDEDVHPVSARVIAVTAASLYVLVLLLLGGAFPVLGPFAIVSGAVIPLAVVGIADEIAEGAPEREQQRDLS